MIAKLTAALDEAFQREILERKEGTHSVAAIRALSNRDDRI